MRVPYFRGVFMRDALPISGAHRNESGIVNLDDAQWDRIPKSWPKCQKASDFNET